MGGGTTTTEAEKYVPPAAFETPFGERLLLSPKRGALKRGPP